MQKITGKLIQVYNQSYKNALNLNEKTKNNTLLRMQGKNQFLNICEYQTISAIFRLLRTNQYFHEGKKDTEGIQAEQYISRTYEMLGKEAEEMTYKELRKVIKTRYEEGIDTATLIIKNNDFARII